MVATIRRKLKANEKKEVEVNLKHTDIGPDTDEQYNINPNIVRLNQRAHEISYNKGSHIDVGNVTEAMKNAAAETLSIKPSKGKRQDCGPEKATLIDKRLQAISQHNEEEVKQIIKPIKKMTAQKKEKHPQLNESYGGNWTSVKRSRMGFVPGDTKVTNRRGEIANDRFRANRFAEYCEEVHWAPTIQDLKSNKSPSTQLAMTSI